MLPNASEINVFFEIAQTQNITKAAVRLGLTQSSLSQSLKRLEDNLGQQLVIRSKTGVTLTPAGKIFFERSQALMHSWEYLKSSINEATTEVRGNIRIGCHPSVGTYSLHRFIPELVTNYPGLEITLIHDLSRKITDSIINYEVDIGLVINPFKHPDLVLLPLQDDSVHLWRRRDIPDHKLPSVLICHPELLQTQAILQNIKKKEKQNGIYFSRVITSNSLENISCLTLAGCGYGIIPARVVSVFKHEEKLMIEPGSPSFQDHLFLVYRNENRNIEVIKKIKNAIINNFR